MSLISEFSSVVRRAMSWVNFGYLACCVARKISLISDSINMLCRAPRRATICLDFRLFNVWHRASSRATFRLNFSLDGVCRSVFRCATLNVSL
jgi:hypothetical protein